MTKNTVEPWNDERVIAEAETIAASYVTLDDDQRRILRSEIIGVLRRQAIAEGQHCESRVEARQAQIERLRAQLAELEQWDSVGMGEIVMCACGEPQCYHAIEFIENDLLIYEDISDKSEGAVVVRLPYRGWRVQRRKEAQTDE